VIPEGLSKTTRALIDFQKVPEAVKKHWWDVFNNNLALSFITNKSDEKIAIRNFAVRQLDFLATLPLEDFTWETSEMLTQVKSEFYKQLFRAKGTQRRIWNERSLIAMQIQEGISTSNNANANGSGRRKIFGLF